MYLSFEIEIYWAEGNVKELKYFSALKVIKNFFTILPRKKEKRNTI